MGTASLNSLSDISFLQDMNKNCLLIRICHLCELVDGIHVYINEHIYRYIAIKTVSHLINRKCPKISYINMADKMANVNNADPNQTAPEGAI